MGDLVMMPCEISIVTSLTGLINVFSVEGPPCDLKGRGSVDIGVLRFSDVMVTFFGTNDADALWHFAYCLPTVVG
jgi:hypothetical protein